MSVKQSGCGRVRVRECRRGSILLFVARGGERAGATETADVSSKPMRFEIGGAELIESLPGSETFVQGAWLMARVRTPSFWMVFWTVPTWSSTLSMRSPKFSNSVFAPWRGLPDLVAFFLDGEHMEAHLEAGEDGEEGGGAGDGDVALGLNLGLQGVAAHDLGVEAFGGEEHDGVGRGGGRSRCTCRRCALPSVRMRFSKALPAAAISSGLSVS